MDKIEARLKCLELASVASQTKSPTEILETATSWSEFVIGEAVKESKSAYQEKGADDPVRPLKSPKQR